MTQLHIGMLKEDVPWRGSGDVEYMGGREPEDEKSVSDKFVMLDIAFTCSEMCRIRSSGIRLTSTSL